MGTVWTMVSRRVGVAAVGILVAGGLVAFGGAQAPPTPSFVGAGKPRGWKGNDATEGLLNAAASAMLVVLARRFTPSPADTYLSAQSAANSA